ncbi:hypothetical protein [Marivita sp. GX14005]|uniref:hypothetical protein n=1 Tax=Marivita sp. GX14005 TaxID=2942276 RepID=UPI0020190FD4|nr:hypothetical protein [Marivita sp. GX14005]MCL3883941.1 hypothetical protein [Marivita sp. GX14005]
MQGALPGLFPDPRKDWSNQELADLFRVRQLLSGANVPVETDRGVTDEGDPWFVFCHAATGEVFIHLCRIDGAYILDSPNVKRPLRGADFNGLIADFTNQALPAQDEDRAGRRVIRLERGGKVRLHPSAMLAALIWTLFLASEEIVLLAPEEGGQQPDSDALLDFDGLFAMEGSGIDLADPDSAIDAADGPSHPRGDAHEPDQPSDFQTQVREALSQQNGLTAHQNAFTMGLSTIAIAMGFMSETVLLDNQRKVLAGLKELGLSDLGADAQQVADADTLPAPEDGALLELLADFLGLDLSLDTELAEAQTGDSALEDAELAHLNGDVIAEERSTLIAKLEKLPTQDDRHNIIGHVEPAEKPPLMFEKPIDESSEQASKSTESSEETASLQKIIQDWQLQPVDFKVKDSDFLEIVGFKPLDDFEWTDSTLDEDSNNTASLESYDYAEHIIEFFKNKGGDVGILEYNDGLIIIDREAISGGDVSYLHWESKDGQIVSLIGLTSDFEQFNLLVA